MDCDFTKEISLLVDGELTPHASARLDVHLEGCATCRQARDSFLLLRRELRSDVWRPDPHVQRAALSAILDASATPRGRASTIWGGLAAALGLQPLRPAHAAALLLLLTLTALGLLWLKTSRPALPAAASTNGLPPQRATASEGEKSPNSADSQRQHTAPFKAISRRAGLGPRRGGRRSESRSRAGLSREPTPAPAPVEESPLSFSAAPAYALESARVTTADDSALRIGRHAERVERLLRSFRNARLTKNDPTLEVAEARRLSKRLLYSNIALRREAESDGDLSAEGLLDSVEPILIDISNLPDTPAPGAVGSIKERINRRRLVGALQVQGMLVSR